MKFYKSLLNEVYGESGQILLFVMVVLLLLMVIVFAIVVNVRVDIRETQIEREYEKGYSSAEEEIFKISVDGFDNWRNTIETNNEGSCSVYANGDTFDYPNYCSFPEFDVCCIVRGGTEGDKIVKRATHDEIYNMSIKQDETLEVNLVGASGTLTVGWGTAPAMSIMLVCKDSSAYSQVRAAVCRDDLGSGSCGMSGTTGFWSLDTARSDPAGPLSLGNCPSGNPLLLRMRAIGSDATNISVSGNDLPPQMVELRVQGFPAGLEDSIEEGLPGPELQTLVPIEKRLPSLFDYVLFVGSGSVSK